MDYEIEVKVSKRAHRKIKKYALNNGLTLEEAAVELLDNFIKADEYSINPESLYENPSLKYYNFLEASEILKVDYSTLLKYIKSGLLKASENNDKALIPHDDLLDFKNRLDKESEHVSDILAKSQLNPVQPLTEEEMDELDRL